VNEEFGWKNDLAAGYGDSIYLIAWDDHRGVEGFDIYCARVSRDGHTLDTTGVLVCDEVMDQYMPDVGFDGENFLVAWQDIRSGMTNGIYAARVSPAGVVLDPDGFAVAATDTIDAAAPAVCFTGTDHLVTWGGFSMTTYEGDIYGALVSPAGRVTRPQFVISDAAYDQGSPAAAAGPTNALVAWEDARSGLPERDIYAARVRADGTVLEPDGLLVANNTGDEQMPCVTAEDGGFGVLWSRWDYTDTAVFAAARVSTGGNVNPAEDWFRIRGADSRFDVTSGSGPEQLLLFNCLTDTALGRYYGVSRVWGRFGDVTGVRQAEGRQLGNATRGASVVRGVLWLPPASSLKPQAASLLDISGRKVADLRPGANDVSRLSPGVYFVRAESSAVCREPSAITKVVVTR
jgi:hypothetical protein